MNSLVKNKKRLVPDSENKTEMSESKVLRDRKDQIQTAVLSRKLLISFIGKVIGAEANVYNSWFEETICKSQTLSNRQIKNLSSCVLMHQR